VEESNTRLDADVKWAQVPEWVIVASISDRAVRLYALLARRANADAQAFPSRGYLAERMSCSRKSVDRALEELLSIGAVTKQEQFINSRQTVNLYTLRAMAGTPVTRGRDTGDAGEGDTGVPQNESHKNESHKKTLRTATQPRKREPDLIFEAIANACGIDITQLTGTSRGQLNKAAKELKEIGATPEDVTAKAQAFRRQYEQATLTPTALAKHWPQLASATHKVKQGPATCPDCYQPLTDHDPEIHDMNAGRWT
jgi:biotin operon repressor